MVTQPDTNDREYEKLVAEGIKAGKKGDAAQWRLGDLALQVATRYGEGTLEEYAERIDMEYRTLRVWRWVAKAFPENVRRPTLRWSHHQLVAAKPDASEWLDKAQADRWTSQELKRQLRGDSGPTTRAVSGRRMTDEERMSTASRLIQQAVTEAQGCPDPDERLELLEGRLFGIVDEINQLRLGIWYDNNWPTPERQELTEKVRREVSEMSDEERRRLLSPEDQEDVETLRRVLKETKG